jgi:four helix bundle protein
MAFKFEKLEVWNLSMDLAEQINTMTDTFPKKEIFNLSSQIRRAADSISLNISEGTTSVSDAELSRYISIAIRSLHEVVCCLYKCIRRAYISQTEFDTYYNAYDKLSAKLQAFKNAINKKK